MFSPFYTDEAAFLRDLLGYLFEYRPLVTDISATRIVVQDDDREHELTAIGVDSALQQALIEWYVLSTWRGTDSVIRALQSKVTIRNVPIISPSKN